MGNLLICWAFFTKLRAFMLGKPDLDLHLVSHQWGQHPEEIRLYTEHYGRVDVWAAKAQHIPTAEWPGPSEALCPLGELTAHRILFSQERTSKMRIRPCSYSPCHGSSNFCLANNGRLFSTK